MRIAIIGGGPVGLYLAASIVESGKDQVYVFEKRSTPTRRQTIVLDRETLEQLGNKMPLVLHDLLGDDVTKTLGENPNAEGCYIVPPPTTEQGICFTEENTRLPLAIAEMRLIEKYIKESLAITANVKPIYGEPEIDTRRGIVTVNDVKYPFDVLIGADGANSIVRRDVLQCHWEPLDQTTYAMIALLQTQKGTFKQTLNQPPPLNIITPRQHSRRVFRNRNGDLLYLGLTLPADIATRIKEGKLTRSLDYIIKYTCQLSGTPCTNIEPKISVFELTPSKSSCWYRELNGRYYFLVGDAAMTTHFFTGSGLNNGFRMADLLEQVLSFSRSPEDIAQALSQLNYDQRMTEIVDKNVSDISQIVTSVNQRDLICRDRKQLIEQMQQVENLAYVNPKRFSNAELCLLLGDRVLGIEMPEEQFDTPVPDWPQTKLRERDITPIETDIGKFVWGAGRSTSSEGEATSGTQGFRFGA